MHSKPKDRSRSGLSLVEAMVAVALFSLTVMGAGIAISSSLASQRRALFTSFASEVLRDQVERTRALSASAVSALASSETLTIPDPFGSNPLSKQSTLTRSVTTVTDFPGMLQITYTLRHTFNNPPLVRATTIRYHPNGLVGYYVPNGS